jgi:hypothetical protein
MNQRAPIISHDPDPERLQRYACIDAKLNMIPLKYRSSTWEHLSFSFARETALWRIWIVVRTPMAGF